MSIYIHIPFCSSICSYCDFCKIIYNKKYINEYLDMLEKEIKDRYKGEEVHTIFIGGGTPTCLDYDELKKLLDITLLFKKSRNIEFTIESNVESITEDKLKLLRNYGVNRISIGVQSFNNDVLKVLGRSHRREDIFDKIRIVKKYFDNINIDLIYAAYNDINILKDDLDCFLSLDITHLSTYSLMIEDHTLLKINNFRNINEDLDYEMYSLIEKTLNSKGYKHYEISNYAKLGYESIHNKNYWLNGEYYGFGLGAVSYLNNYRISNTKNISKYLDNNYIDKNEYEDINTRKENDLILGLRLIDGININDFNKKYNDDLLNKDIIKKLVNDGYLIVNNNNLKCNKDYIYLENIILEKIMGSEL